MRILVIDPDEAGAAELTAELLEAGYEAQASDGPDEDLGDWKPQLVVGVLESDADAVLTRVAALLEARLARVPSLLFCGGDAEGLETARERYPGASFANRAMLQTAVASLRT